MSRGHKGDGWKKLTVAMNAHIGAIEQSILERQPGTRSALIALAVKSLREWLVDEQVAFSEYQPFYHNHMVDYGNLVVAAGSVATTIWLTNETEADLQALGEWFEANGLKQLLGTRSGYNRKLLIYMALRWYAEQTQKTR